MSAQTEGYGCLDPSRGYLNLGIPFVHWLDAGHGKAASDCESVDTDDDDVLLGNLAAILSFVGNTCARYDKKVGNTEPLVETYHYLSHEFCSQFLKMADGTETMDKTLSKSAAATASAVSGCRGQQS